MGLGHETLDVYRPSIGNVAWVLEGEFLMSRYVLQKKNTLMRYAWRMGACLGTNSKSKSLSGSNTMGVGHETLDVYRPSIGNVAWVLEGEFLMSRYVLQKKIH